MIGLEQVTPAGQENTEPVVMPDDEVLYELADLFRVFGDSTRDRKSTRLNSSH